MFQSTLASNQGTMKDPAKIDYPTPRRDESVAEDHFGTKVSDPYRWMEDPDSAETKAFVEAQNNVSMPFIHGCSEREAISKVGKLETKAP